jgi:hypothetical protein
LPFIKAGLPVKPLPDMKEGTYTSCGSSALSVVTGSGVDCAGFEEI